MAGTARNPEATNKDRISPWHLGLGLWWAWAYVLFYSPTFFADMGSSTASVSIDTWVASCAGYVIAMVASIALSKKISPISSNNMLLILSPTLTCGGTVLVAAAYHQSFVDPWFIAVTGGFATGIGTAWLSLAWGELFGAMGMAKTGKLVSLSLFLGVVLNSILVSIPTAVCIPLTVSLPAISILALWKSKTVHQVAYAKRPDDNITPSVFPWKLFVNIGAMGLAFGYIKGVGLTGEVYEISPYILFVVVAIISFVFVFWTNVLKRNLNVSLIYRVTMAALIVSFMLIPFLDGIAVGWAAAAVTACYDCFDMVIWALMANIVALTSTSAVRVFGSGRLANHLGMIIGAFLGWLASTIFQQSQWVYFSMPTIVVFILVVCAFATLGEARFFATPVEDVRRMSNPSEDIDEASARIAKQYDLTPREEEVVRYLGRGRNAAYIAETLVISENTVKSHAKHIYRKLSINTQQQLLDLIEEQT